MILVKKLKFFHLLCLSKIDGEKVFADVLDKFSKGVSPSFWLKI